MLRCVATRCLKQASSAPTRHLSASAALMQKQTATDPIQKLFLDKIKEYNTKSKSAEGGLVECTADARKSLNDELDKISKMFGATGPDFMTLPTFNFTEPTLEAVGVDGKAKDSVGPTTTSEETAAA